MKKNLTAFMLLAIFLAPTIANALAWVQGDYTAGWVTRNHDSWESANDKESRYFIYTEGAYTDFQSWTYRVRNLEVKLGGIPAFSIMRQEANMTIYDTAKTHIVSMVVVHESHLWPFGIVTAETIVYFYVDGAATGPFHLKEPGYLVADIYFWKKAADEIGFSGVLRTVEGNPIETGENSFIIGEGWFDEVNLEQTVKKRLLWGAIGRIKGVKLNEQIISGEEPISDPIANVTVLTWWERLMKTAIDSISDIGTSIFGDPKIRNVYVTIQQNEGGKCNLEPDLYVTQAGTYFNVIAQPNGGYKFAYWLINGTSTNTNNPLSILVNGDTTIKPYFSSLPPEPEKPTLPAYMPTLLAFLTPGLVISALGGSFWKLGDKMGEHGIAGFLAGGGMGFILCTQIGLIPMWITITMFSCATICIYFWFRSE